MAGKQPSTTTQISKVELPEWVEKASEDNYNLAKTLGSEPFKPYQGDRVADTSQGLLAAFKMMQDGAGSSQGNYSSASNIFNLLNKEAGALDPTKINSQNVKAGTVTAGGTAAQNTTAGTVKAQGTTSQDVKSRDVTAQMLADMDLSKYLNPYTDEVVNKSLDDMDRSRLQSLNSNSSAAQAAGAFGGSRHGIVDAVTNSETARASGLLASQLRSDAFNNAQNMAVGDISRKIGVDTGNADRSLTAGMSNADRRLQSDTNDANRMLQALMSNRDAALQSDTNNANRRLTSDMSDRDAALQAATGNRDAALNANTNNANRNLSAQQANAQNILDTFLAKSGSRNTAAQGLMSAAAGSQSAKMQDIAGLMQTGTMQRAIEQENINDKMDRFNEKRNNDIENLNLRLSALGMSPYGKTENTQKTTQGGSSGTDFGQLGMGLLSLFLGLSEDDTKTDKEKVGKVPGTDLELWAYRYKKDPKTYPKVVGVMASDVEKKMPEAVHKVNGKRVINYGLIGERMNAHA